MIYLDSFDKIFFRVKNEKKYIIFHFFAFYISKEYSFDPFIITIIIIGLHDLNVHDFFLPFQFVAKNINSVSLNVLVAERHI